MRDIQEIATAIDAEQPVTRAEADAVVRAIGRTCTGPFKSMSERTFREFLKRVGEDTAFTKEERESAIAIAQRAATAQADAAGIVAAFRTQGHVQGATLANSMFRAGCGQDLNEVILAGPLDGDEHLVPCPGCGREVSYRAPFIRTA